MGDAPAEFQADLAASIAWTTTPCGTLRAGARPRRRWCGSQEPLEKNANVTISDAEWVTDYPITHCCRSLHVRKVQAAALPAGAAITFLLATNYKTSMSTYLPAELRQQLVGGDDHRWPIVRQQPNTAAPMVVDHISPKQRSQTAFHNLCFACRRCNRIQRTNYQEVGAICPYRRTGAYISPP